MNIKVGDVVRLKSSGTDMAVEGVSEHTPTQYDRRGIQRSIPGNYRTIFCVWFDKVNGDWTGPHRARFVEDALVFVRS